MVKLKNNGEEECCKRKDQQAEKNDKFQLYFLLYLKKIFNIWSRLMKGIEIERDNKYETKGRDSNICEWIAYQITWSFIKGYW